MLLDTHALLWLVNAESALTAQALSAIATSQLDKTLYVSPITGWELAVAAQKAPGHGRPDLGGQSPREWLREALGLAGAKLVPINQRISFEAAEVPAHYGRRDPGDCFLIATARVRRIPIITRDAAMHDLSLDRPDYLSVIVC